MPVTKSKARGPGALVGLLPEVDVFEPGFARVLQAGFERENTIVSFFSAGPSGSDRRRAGPQFDPLEQNPQFDPSGVSEEFDQFEHIPEDLRAFSEAYQFAPNRESIDLITAQIRHELENERVLAASGFGGFAAGFAGSMFDPIIMFPPVRAVATGARAVSVLRGGLATARAGFLGAGAAEALLHGSQETRTGLESAFNVAGATILSGVLGGALTRITRGSRSNTFGPKATPREALDSVAAAVERDLDPDEAVPDIRDEGSFVIPDEEIPEVAPAAAREVQAVEREVDDLADAPAPAAKVEPVDPAARAVPAADEAPTVEAPVLGTGKEAVRAARKAEGIPDAEEIVPEIDAPAAVAAVEPTPAVKGLETFDDNGVPLLDVSGRPIASFVIRNKETGEVIMETFDRAKVARLKTDKFEAIPIGDHLASLNEPAAAARAAPKAAAPEPEVFVPQHQAALVEHVFNTKKSLDPKVVAKALGITESEARKELNVLVLRGRIKQTQPGALKKKARGKARKQPEFRRVAKRGPMDVLEFIASIGGVRDQGGELAARDAQQFIPGLGPLVRPTGKSFDELAEALWEAGYFGPPATTERPDINAVLELIDEGLHGNRRFSDFDLEELTVRAESREAEENAIFLDEAVADITGELEGAGFKGIGRPQLEEIAEIMADGRSLDDAAEEVIMRGALSADERAGRNVIDETEIAPGVPAPREGEEIPFGSGGIEPARGERGIAGEAPQGRAGGQADDLAVEATEQGDQLVIPGAERITDKQLAERQGDAPLRAKAPQQAADEGLFDTGAARQTDIIDFIPPEPTERGSVGAASALPTRSESTVKSAFGLERVLALGSPSLRMMTSPFLASRRASQALATSAAVHNGNTLGIETPASVELHVKAYRVGLSNSIQALDRLWNKHRTGMAEGGRAARLRQQARDVVGGRPGDKLSFKQFREEVGRAMRRADEHEVAEVAEAAKFLRREGFDPLKDKAIAAKLLPEDLDVKTALSYLTRVYKTEKIVARRTEFEDIVTRWLIERRDTVDAPALAKAEAEIAERAGHVLERPVVLTKLIGKRGAIRKFVIDRATRDDLELQEIASEITDRIISTPAGRLPYDAHIGRPQGQSFQPKESPRGPLARRVFLIPDEMIEEFLESDADIIVRAYHRTMAPDVEVVGRFGDVDMIPQMKDIAKEAADATRLVDQDPAFKTPEARERARTRINARKDEDIADLMGMLERLKNVHGRPDNPHGIGVRLLRGAREVNLLSKLGGMTLSAAPDIFRPVMVEGVTRVMRHAVVPLITNLKGLRIARAEARELAAVVELSLDTRMAAIADIGDDFGRHTKVERGLKAMTDTFGLVSLMAPWNQFWKETAATVTMGRILTESANWRAGTIKVADIERLAAGDINQPMAIRIANEFDKVRKDNPMNTRGVLIAGTEHWEDRGAAKALSLAMIREVDQTIVTPGIGDRPFWMTSTQAGQNIGQFKSFFFASAQSVLLSGLQRRDLATLNGAILMISGGIMVYYLKQKLAGREVSDDPAVWITEGIDRSGVLGWFFDVNNIMEKVGLGVLPGGPTRSRYASRNVVGAMLGPTAGMASDIASIVGNTVAGDIRASDTRALRRLVPYQNLFYMRQLLDKAGEAGNKAFGIPESRRKRRTKRRSFAR